MTGFMRRVLLFAGHGRALESYLVGVKILFAIFIVHPVASGGQVTVIADLTDVIPSALLAAPFFLIGVTQGLGLWLNYRGVERSWMFRAAGAWAAMLLWNWVIVKSILVGVVVSGIMPFSIMSMLASVFILWKSLNRLPVPGAVGL